MEPDPSWQGTEADPTLPICWFPWAPWGFIFYGVRAIESGRPLFFFVAAAVIIGVLAWKKPPGWIWWAAGAAAAAIALAILTDSHSESA
jgi:hypothetical protein